MRKNLSLKLLSLLTACLLAYYVNGRLQNSVISFILPIEIKNLPDDKIILQPTNLQARVTLRGPSYLVSKIATNPSALKVNLPKGINVNALEVPINTNELELPPSVKIDGIEPAKLVLRLDDKVEQVIKVRVSTFGEVSKSLELKSIISDPKTIKTTGPQTLLMNLPYLETAPIDLRDISETSTIDAVVLLPNEFTKLGRQKISVTVNVAVKKAEREFTDLPIEIRAVSGAYKANLKTASVQLSGPLELIDSLSEANIIPYVRIEKDFSGTQQHSLQVDKLEGVDVLNINTKTINVTRSN
ncbi:MAG: hypothetical protein KDD56_06455 [Bdellovibrionales bacterium]|nr:hypothetical protein [Bdellovibrionales bacterium]